MAKAMSTAEDEVKERISYKSPYEQWKESEGLPTYRGLFVKNLYDIELSPWKSSGDGLAAFLNLEGTGGFNDSYVAEIPPGNRSKPIAICSKRPFTFSRVRALPRSGSTRTERKLSSGRKGVISRSR